MKIQQNFNILHLETQRFHTVFDGGSHTLHTGIQQKMTIGRRDQIRGHVACTDVVDVAQNSKMAQPVRIDACGTIDRLPLSPPSSINRACQADQHSVVADPEPEPAMTTNLQKPSLTPILEIS